MRLIQARNYTRANRKPEDIRLEILHTMQAAEKPSTAEAVANWFAGPTAPRASAHYCFDNDSEVQCVLDRDVAWAAPGANHDGRQYEMAGYAQQTLNEWKDPFSLAMLARVALVMSAECDESGNPKTWLSDREVELGRRGITHHLTISRVYKRSTHWDVGYNFPVDLFIDLVRAAPLLGAPKQEPALIMNECVGALVCPLDGGFQKLQSDGGVFCTDGCTHFHGSYMGLRNGAGRHPDEGNLRRFDSPPVRHPSMGATGYILFSTWGEPYRFPGVS